MIKIVRPLRSGQITIPYEFRKQLGIGDHTLLKVRVDQGELRIKPVTTTEQAKGSAWMKDLYKYFSPVRAQIKKTGSSTDEINQAIDQAVHAVASKHGKGSN